MQYHRIIISVHSELDMDTIKGELKRLKVPFTSPMGYIDSETVFFIAPKISKNQVENLRKHGRKAIMRAFRHVPKRGYLTAIIISEVPEIAFKRVVELIRHFWQSRLKGLLNKLGIQPYQYNYKVENLISITNNITSRVIENLSLALRNILSYMTSVVCYMMKALKSIIKEIGFQNTLVSAIRLINEIKGKDDKVRLLEMLMKIYALNTIKPKTKIVTQTQEPF